MIRHLFILALVSASAPCFATLASVPHQKVPQGKGTTEIVTAVAPITRCQKLSGGTFNCWDKDGAKHHVSCRAQVIQAGFFTAEQFAQTGCTLGTLDSQTDAMRK